MKLFFPTTMIIASVNVIGADFSGLEGYHCRRGSTRAEHYVQQSWPNFSETSCDRIVENGDAIVRQRITMSLSWATYNTYARCYLASFKEHLQRVMEDSFAACTGELSQIKRRSLEQGYVTCWQKLEAGDLMLENLTFPMSNADNAARSTLLEIVYSTSWANFLIGQHEASARFGCQIAELHFAQGKQPLYRGPS